MKLSQLAGKPQLIQIALDDEETVKEFGEALEFWTWDRQPMATFLKLASVDAGNPSSIIESVKFVNLQSTTVPITCYWGDANGVPRAHLAFGLQLPPNTSVELLQSTKRINQGDALYASYTAGAGNGVSAFVSARYGPAYTIDTFTSSVLPGNTITASFGTSANEGTSLYYTIE